MADDRLRTKRELKRLFTDLRKKGITDDMISILIDTLWRDRVNQRTSGFYNAGGKDSVISFDPVTRFFSISPFNPEEENYEPRYAIFSWANVAVHQRIYYPHSILIPNEEGLFCVYFDKEPDPGRNQVLFYAKNPTAQELETIYVSKVLISCFYWDAINNEMIHFGDDRHGSEWNPQIHHYLHTAFYARRKSGLVITGASFGGDGSINAHAKFSVIGGVMLHDDFELTIGSSSDSLPILYQFGTLPRYVYNFGYAIYKGVARACYNGGGALVQATSNWFVLYHIFATNEIGTQTRKIISVMGSAQYETLAAAYAAVDSELVELNTWMPQQGRLHINTIIIQTSDDFTNDPATIIAGIANKTHPPVTIAENSASLASINQDQELTIEAQLPAAEMSVTGNGTPLNKLKLVNDVASPGNYYYYGTNISGNKGFFMLPFTGDNVYIVYNETELLAAYASAISYVDKSATIYIGAIITLTASRSFIRTNTDAKITFWGIGSAQTWSINSRTLTVNNITFRNIAFTTTGSTYVTINGHYGHFYDCWWWSEVAYNATIGNMKIAIKTTGTMVNNTGGIVVSGMRHASSTDSTLNNSGDVQPFIIQNTATWNSAQNLYISLLNVEAISSYDRFSRLLLHSTANTNYKVTGDLSWYYHPVQNFPGTGFILSTSEILKRGSVDDLRGDYVPSGTLVTLLGIDENNKIRKATYPTIPETHPPVTIHADSATRASIDGNQVLTVNVQGGGGGVSVMEKDYEFCVTNGATETFKLDIYCTGVFTITKAYMESDGTMNGVAININGTAIAGLDNMNVSTIAEFLSTANNVTAQGNVVTVVTTTSMSGIPSVLRVKLVYQP